MIEEVACPQCSGPMVSRKEYEDRATVLGLPGVSGLSSDLGRRREALLKLALSGLPDSETAGPDGTGYKYAWDELTGDEQDWVKDIRRRITALGEGL